MSFSERTEKLVNELIDVEYVNACEQYGCTYKCMQEMLEVLSEEVKEVFDELRLAETEVVETKFLTKSYNTETLLKLEKYTRNAIKERLEKANIVAKILETTEDNFEEVFCFKKLKELLGDTNDKR